MKTALFVDFDNVYSGLRRISAQAAERFAKNPARWLRWLTDEMAGAVNDAEPARRRVLVRRCYLNPVMFQGFRRPFHEAGFEIVDCPPMTAAGKTTTDIHLVLDTMDALADTTHFDEFIVFSADADFSPVLRRLRRHDRRTMVFAAGAMSEAYKASADRVIPVHEFLEEALELAAGDGEDRPPMNSGDHRSSGDPDDVEMRRQVATLIVRLVREADEPVKLPFLASALNRDLGALRQGRWAGFPSFQILLRSLQLPGIVIDYEAGVALDLQRLQAADDQRDSPDQIGDAQAAPTAPGPGGTGPQSPEEVHQAAAALLQEMLAASDKPLKLSTVGQVLKARIPALAQGWNGSPTLAAMIKRMDLGPIRRATLGDGTTVVLFDATRHQEPAGFVSDALVASMLRVADLPDLRPFEFRAVLEHVRPHMGNATSFEIEAVSLQIHHALLSAGISLSVRRISAMLQGLIFGGLSTTVDYPDDQALMAEALGVILSTWAREMQMPVDDEARARLLDWVMEGAVQPAGPAD